MEAVGAAIAAVTARVPARDLARAAEALAIRYRTPAGGADVRDATALPGPLTDAARAAYLVVRAPATYAAVSAVLRELADRCPDFAPRRLLDLGTGPGVGIWAALARWPGITDVTAIERDRGFIDLAREIVDTSGLAQQRTIDWRARDLRTLTAAPATHAAPDRHAAPAASAASTAPSAPGAHRHASEAAVHPAPGAAPAAPITPSAPGAAQHASRTPPPPGDLPAADLTLMSYAIGELPPDARQRALDAAWDATTTALVVIEPGTPRHFAAILDARTRLLQRGATIAAPCPHHGPCPMAAAGDWCHVSVRLARSRQHRQLKAGQLSYEDEKFSYLIAVRPSSHTDSPSAPPCPALLHLHPGAARIVRHPQYGKGHVTLTLCTATGLRTETIGRHAREAYRRARDARWGDAWTSHDSSSCTGSSPPTLKE